MSMSKSIAANMTGAEAATVLDPQPLAKSKRSLSWWVGTGISIAILAVVIREMARVDFAMVRSIMPTSVWFWIVFAVTYFASPLGDWVIFRRLWKIPATGFLALTRKLIGNELLLGYIGELYFYTWARRQTGMTSAPFGAIKDVAILSALTGNIVTLLLLVMSYPLLGQLHLALDSKTLLLSVGVVLGTSSLMLVFRRRLFTLGRSDIIFISWVHIVRIIGITALNAWCWHLALPAVDLQWWLLLSSMRLLLGRLPLLPNKELVFAGLAVFLIGHDAEIGALMTMMASLILVTHLALGLALVAWEAASWRRP
jgi:hypothetical protein